MEEMVVGRSSRRKAESRQLKVHELCNGPSKLCQALNITKVRRVIIIKCVCVYIYIYIFIYMYINKSVNK